MHANGFASFLQAPLRKLRLRGVVVVVLLRILVPCLFLPLACATDSIVFSEKQKVWVLQSGDATYAFGVNERDELQHLYWGERLSARDFTTAHSLPEWASFDLSTTTTPQEYPGWGAGLYVEPALKVTFADGNRDVVLHYVDHKIKDNDLEITLKDEISALYVLLHYHVYSDSGILERSAKIENRTSEAITLESAQSASWTLKEELLHRDGRVMNTGWDMYPIATFRDAPESIEVFVEGDEAAPPTGVGEPGAVPTAAAIANAVYAASGARLRSVPLTRERVRKAMAG